jgi:plasmid stabilization system protein ParE
MIHCSTLNESAKRWCVTVGLDELPYQGRKVPELNEEYIRELGLYSCRIIYEIKTDHVEILAVIHKRRDFTMEDLP